MYFFNFSIDLIYNLICNFLWYFAIFLNLVCIQIKNKYNWREND